MSGQVGLCMIVRNEAHVIERCLASVRPFIDYWTIVDTGSTDGTQDVVRKAMAGRPGQLLERPWVNFGHNRTEALQAARPHTAYTFVIDADEVLAVPEGFRWPTLTADSVALRHRIGNSKYWRAALVANRLPWVYRGVLHEYLEAPGNRPGENLEGPEIIVSYDGGRSLGLTLAEKYARDAATLEAALKDEPDNTRYQFYLARSYKDSGQYERALPAFRRRIQMGGFAEEIFDSLLCIARILQGQGAPFEQVLAAYLAAWNYRPTRAEPLCSLANYCRLAGQFPLGRMFARQAADIPIPNDLLWIEEDAYRWRSLDEYAISSYWTGDYAESAEACRDLLGSEWLPEEQRERVKENLRFAQSKLPGAPTLLPRQIARACAPAAAQETTGLIDLVKPARLTAVVDVGANPVEGDPPFAPLIARELCTVVGFEPLPDALAELQRAAGPNERYLPYAVGDGAVHPWHVCAIGGMSSVLRPDAKALGQFNMFDQWGSIVSVSEIATRRLDDIDDLGPIDLLKIDVQGSELAVFQGGAQTLRSAVAIQTEVSFMTLYENQPTFGDVDVELRAQGFVPHAFAAVKQWALAPYGAESAPRAALNQLLEADVVYVKDFTRPENFTSEQFKHLAVIAHYVFGSYDLALRCLLELEARGDVASDTGDAYRAMLGVQGLAPV